jgi:hypothetical protein
MWNVNARVVPVITGPTGTASESPRKHLINITGKHETKELQKTAISVTAGSANVKVQNIFDGRNNITLHVNNAALYSLGTCFVSGT